MPFGNSGPILASELNYPFIYLFYCYDLHTGMVFWAYAVLTGRTRDMVINDFCLVPIRGGAFGIGWPKDGNLWAI